MRNAGGFQLAYTGGWFYVLTLIFPHSITANLAFPDKVLHNDNIYAVLPSSNWKIGSVWLMNLHQVVSFAIYSIPLLYMWEKLLRVHSRPAYIRLPLRLPISCAIWLLALAFPFYGTLNALYAAASEPWVAFIFPSLMHTIAFRREADRRAAALKPFKCLQIGNWAPVFFINISIVVLWTVFQFGFGLFFAIKELITNVTDFGVFAKCYQCNRLFPAE
ncbi:g3808 [Coccomyxa viridis]|uniref:G3808 protein n=1 Tax=Coccomyxa viridis TaxID=1274662 RepID=A0ABP1FNN7_9CHLO